MTAHPPPGRISPSAQETETDPTELLKACEKVCTIIRRISRILPQESNFGAHSELLDSGFIGSLELVELSHELEQTFHVTLTEADLFHELFSTPHGIAQIVLRRNSTGAPVPDGW